MVDGKGGVGSRFSLRADLVTKYAGRPPKTLTGDVLAPSLAGRRAARKPCLPTSTFLVKVRSGFYGRTEPEDTFYYFSYRTWWSRASPGVLVFAWVLPIPAAMLPQTRSIKKWGRKEGANRGRGEKKGWRWGDTHHNIRPGVGKEVPSTTIFWGLGWGGRASTSLNM